MNNERYERGLKRLREVVGDAGVQVIEALSSVAPDMARFTVEFSYGDVYARAALSDRSRQITAVASLATLGHALPQLRVHINGALNVGCSPMEIAEVILQTALYAGFPTATNAMLVARDVFAERDVLGHLQAA